MTTETTPTEAAPHAGNGTVSRGSADDPTPAEVAAVVAALVVPAPTPAGSAATDPDEGWTGYWGRARTSVLP